jgi:hypothetical protein
VTIFNNLKSEESFRSLIKYLYENPFNIIGISDYEIRHSRVIAWLLDPSVGHGLSEFVIKNLLVNVIKKYRSDFQGIDVTDISIHIEWNVEETGERIDIVGVSNKNNFVIVIENKVNASQRPGQLSSYRKAIETKYAKHTYYPFFLSLFGDTPNEEEDWYMILSYSDILYTLSNLLRAIENKKYQVSDKILNFIKDYKNTISKHLYLNDEIIEYGQELYNKYKSIIKHLENYKDDLTELEYKALKIIQDYMKSVPYFYFQNAYESFLHKFSEQTGQEGFNEIVHLQGFFKGRTEFWFVPLTIYQEQLGKLISTNWKSPVPFAYFFIKEGDKITLNVELGPVNFLHNSLKVSNRDELVDFIIKDGKGEWSDLAPRANTQKWVKLYSESREVPSWSSQSVIFSILEDLYTNGFSTINDQIFALVNEIFEE